MLRPCLCTLAAVLVWGCGEPAGAGCGDAPVGATGTRAGDALTICAREPSGTPRAGVAVTDGEGAALGLTDADGRIEVSGSGPFLLEAAGFVSEVLTAPDAASRVVVELALAERPGTRTIEVTVSSDLELPSLEAGAVRQVEVRASVALEPLDILDAVAAPPLGVCELTGERCSVTIEAPLGASDLSMVLADVAEDGARSIRGIAGAPNVPDGVSVSLVALGRSAELSEVPLDAVVGVPGLVVGSEVLFFGPASLDAPIPLPSEGTAWVALQHGEEGAGLGIARGVETGPLAAPTAPPITLGSEGVLILPSDLQTRFRVSGRSSSGEVWRATVYESEIPTGLSVPEGLSELAVAAYQIEAGSEPFAAVTGARRLRLP